MKSNVLVLGLIVLIFGVGVDSVDVARFANILSCEPASFLFTYSGLPIGANMKLSRNWNPFVEKFNVKLSTWKAINLSFGVRLTLVNFVLGSLLLCYFSIFKAPKKVIDLLESIRRNFLWGGIDNKKKINWAAWDVVTRPKDKGGLGVGYLRTLNLALLVKWSWGLKVESNTL